MIVGGVLPEGACGRGGRLRVAAGKGPVVVASYSCKGAREDGELDGSSRGHSISDILEGGPGETMENRAEPGG